MLTCIALSCVLNTIELHPSSLNYIKACMACHRHRVLVIMRSTIVIAYVVSAQWTNVLYAAQILTPIIRNGWLYKLASLTIIHEKWLLYATLTCISRMNKHSCFWQEQSLKARFMWPTWGPSGADMIQVGPILAPWTLLSGIVWSFAAGYYMCTLVWTGYCYIGMRCLSIDSINR